MANDSVSARVENKERSTKGANRRPRWRWWWWAITWIVFGPGFVALFEKTGGPRLTWLSFVGESLLIGSLASLVVFAWRRGGVIVRAGLVTLALLAALAVARVIYHKSREDAASTTCTQISQVTGAKWRLGPTPTGRGTRCYLIFPDGRVESIYLS